MARRPGEGARAPPASLYAIYGDAEAWADLGLDPQPGSALYIGKSEDDLVRRELDTHFAADPTKKPRTGSSTVRRSFAALLRDALDLHAVPRNPDKPGYFSNYGLTPDGDARLTAWMHERLSLAVWERPAGLAQPLVEVEVAIIHRWRPPLNIRDNPRPLPRLRLAREVMTREASTSAAPATVLPPRESAPAPAAGARGLTPVELARELGKSPQNGPAGAARQVRQAAVRGRPLGRSHARAGGLPPRPLPLSRALLLPPLQVPPGTERITVNLPISGDNVEGPGSLPNAARGSLALVISLFHKPPLFESSSPGLDESLPCPAHHQHP